MNRRATDRNAQPGASTADAFPDEHGVPLRALAWSEFDQSEPWPENFIVHPDPLPAGPPSGVALPVLTTPADDFDPRDGVAETNTKTPTEPASLFASTAFGVQLRRLDVEDEERSRFHADPASGPASLDEPRSAFAKPNSWWLVLLALLGLLGLAAAAWIWLPSLHHGG